MIENNVFFGVDYYPEHWPRDRWDTDAILMKEAGFDAVRMGEFSWAKMEPELNHFCFEWLDDAISILKSYGLKVVLGTPTAAPPAWIIEGNPEILPVNELGIRMGFGGRHHVCMSNKSYREHIIRFVNEIAEHYRDNDAVIGWQIDNELGNSHKELCMCENCQSGFQEWLKNKYKTIQKLNESYGTVFWSQTYSDFHQIPAPKVTPNSHNPSLLLDWKRFCSDLIIDFQQMQIDIIRSICPDKFITHNFMGFYDKSDYFNLAKNLDFVSHDQYPSGFWLEDPAVTPSSELAANLDFIEGLKDKPFWILEQQAGPTGWEIMGKTPRPGQLRLWTAQSIAHGADAVFYFRWRTCLFGTEQYWHGILPHSGIPGRRYDEIKKTISELHPVMQKIRGVKNRSDVAILFSYDQNWAFQIQPHHPDLNYTKQLIKYYAYFYERNIPVDFISYESDFSEYRLLIAPLQFLSDEDIALKFKTYVKNGGNLIMTMRTGVKDENNVCFSESQLPGPFSELLGIEILDYDCFLKLSVQVTIGDKILGKAQKWCDIINLNFAKAIAFYDEEFYKGTPAVTVNAYGKGDAYYIGFEPDERLMNGIMDIISTNCHIEPILKSQKGVEIVQRVAADGKCYFALNHSDKAVRIMPNTEWKRILGSDVLDPYDIAVFYESIK
ncbi:MAG: beta-galactosidase [Oscillospiraceae bacterium]|nr:beta-galactosidase [Oscillospiraceae bacterium]